MKELFEICSLITNDNSEEKAIMCKGDLHRLKSLLEQGKEIKYVKTGIENLTIKAVDTLSIRELENCKLLTLNGTLLGVWSDVVMEQLTTDNSYEKNLNINELGVVQVDKRVIDYLKEKGNTITVIDARKRVINLSSDSLEWTDASADYKVGLFGNTLVTKEFLDEYSDRLFLTVNNETNVCVNGNTTNLVINYILGTLKLDKLALTRNIVLENLGATSFTRGVEVEKPKSYLEESWVIFNRIHYFLQDEYRKVEEPRLIYKFRNKQYFDGYEDARDYDVNDINESVVKERLDLITKFIDFIENRDTRLICLKHDARELRDKYFKLNSICFADSMKRRNIVDALFRAGDDLYSYNKVTSKLAEDFINNTYLDVDYLDKANCDRTIEIEEKIEYFEDEARERLKFTKDEEYINDMDRRKNLIVSKLKSILDEMNIPFRNHYDEDSCAKAVAEDCANRLGLSQEAKDCEVTARCLVRMRPQILRVLNDKSNSKESILDLIDVIKLINECMNKMMVKGYRPQYFLGLNEVIDRLNDVLISKITGEPVKANNKEKITERIQAFVWGSERYY